MLQFGMALLIDGYNLLNVTGIFAQAGRGTELHRSRLALLNFLASSIDKRERRTTTIVFDAAGAPSGLPRMMTHDGITVQFAQRHSDADELIEDLLEQCAAPRSLLVVSSDHRVQRAARQRGASFIDSEQWYADRLTIARQRRTDRDEASAKPTGAMTPDELSYWLGEFADSPPAVEDSANPFPPGYADDIIEEE
jgi:uncharacterized protein